MPILRQNGQPCPFWPKIAQKLILGSEYQNLSPDSESAPSRYHLCQFSGKTEKFDFFGLNLGKLPNYVKCFGSYNVEDFAES